MTPGSGGGEGAPGRRTSWMVFRRFEADVSGASPVCDCSSFWGDCSPLAGPSTEAAGAGLPSWEYLWECLDRLPAEALERREEALGAEPRDARLAMALEVFSKAMTARERRLVRAREEEEGAEVDEENLAAEEVEVVVVVVSSGVGMGT